MENKVLIILGMHRSGTSLTAQWMHKCEINMGDELMPPTEDNKQGYWEDMDFYKLHLEILQSNGLHPYGLNGNLADIRIENAQISKMQSLIENKILRGIPWGWKEPRTCLFLDHYHHLVKNAFYLIVYRRPEEVIDSLLRREMKDYSNLFNKQGIKGKVKKLFIKWYLKETIEQLTVNYIEKYIFYNQLILNFTEKLNKNDYYVFDIHHIFDIQESLCKKLERSGFVFNPMDAHDIFDEKLMKHTPKIVNKKHILKSKKLIQVYEQLNEIEN